jgi:hypothetical protein
MRKSIPGFSLAFMRCPNAQNNKFHFDNIFGNAMKKIDKVKNKP